MGILLLASAVITVIAVAVTSPSRHTEADRLADRQAMRAARRG